MSIKILATADLHLGKSSSSLSTCEETSVKYTWKLLVEYSIMNEIDVILLCGDIIDKDNKYFEAIGTLQEGFEKLNKNGISVYMVAGNHDYDVLPQMVSDNRYNNVHLLGAKGNWEVDMFIGKNEQSIQFAGWSFPARYVNKDPLLDFNTIKFDNNYPVIGLLHGDVDNFKSEYGRAQLNDLVNKPVNIWLLGHIHKQEELKKHSPAIWYTGSPHALSAKEPGAHGPLLLVVENANDIKVTTIALSPVRYESIQIDITGAINEETVRGKIIAVLLKDTENKKLELQEVNFLVYDVCLVGENSNGKQVEQWASSIINDYNTTIESGCIISVRKVNTTGIRPAVKDLEKLAQQPSPAGILAESILALQDGKSTPFLDACFQKWNPIFQKINNFATYQPLELVQQNQDCENDNKARKYLLAECKLLLGELMIQQTTID